MSGSRPFAERQIRAAEDESAIRSENEQTESNPGSSVSEYACECSRDCDQLVALTVDEYEDVRAVPTHFFVAPGHLMVGVEVVVRDETPRYQVVEKIGAGASVATALDARSHPAHA